MDLIAAGGSSRMRWGRWLVLAFVLVAGVLGPSAVAQADCQKQLDFAVSEVTTDGCLATVAGSNPTQYTTTDAIKLNGIPFPAPPSGSHVTVTLPANASSGGSLSLGTTKIILGGITVFSGNLGTWNLPAGGKGDQKQVVVGGSDDLYSQTLRARRINLISVDDVQQPTRVSVKIRHRHEPAPGTLERTAEDEVLVTFEQPQRAITPGQAAVFYQDDVVVGGGWIS